VPPGNVHWTPSPLTMSTSPSVVKHSPRAWVTRCRGGTQPGAISVNRPGRGTPSTGCGATVASTWAARLGEHYLVCHVPHPQRASCDGCCSALSVMTMQ
jgi:hypothetical protein